ncbi:class I SAM-dependent methyltransferase [Staphylococcus felis]|uniref:class I SAM-dependent DNA methyltransferase n=1 Tax=Staphylococcus felis TaxID=46127 RepID=UPI0039671D6B
MQYQNLSHFYDILSNDQPYDLWLNLIKEIAVKNNYQSILDLGCGTGTLTSQLTHIFPNVYGMDLSAEMLQIAARKSNNVTWVTGDMSDLHLDRSFDMITILCDSLNYVPEVEEVMNTFNHVFHHLNEGGTLIFDVHTLYKVITQFDNQVYLDDRESLTLLWKAEHGELPNSIYHDLTFFIKNDDSEQYTRYDETHFQVVLEKNQYLEMLKLIGFKDIKTFYDFDFENQNPESDRLFFIAKK